jgi:hypothetical protein
MGAGVVALVAAGDLTGGGSSRSMSAIVAGVASDARLARPAANDSTSTARSASGAMTSRTIDCLFSVADAVSIAAVRAAVSSLATSWAGAALSVKMTSDATNR